MLRHEIAGAPNFCLTCRGLGHVRRKTCKRCEGSGQEPTPVTVEAMCPFCAVGVLKASATCGDGNRTSTSVCDACGGTAYVTHTDTGAVIDVAKGAA